MDELEELLAHVTRCEYGCLPTIHVGSHDVHMDRMDRERNLKLLARGGWLAERAFAQEERARLINKAWAIKSIRRAILPVPVEEDVVGYAREWWRARNARQNFPRDDPYFDAQVDYLWARHKDAMNREERQRHGL